MDTGSADILSACGLEARVPVKPWLELSFLGSLQPSLKTLHIIQQNSNAKAARRRLCNTSNQPFDRLRTGLNALRTASCGAPCANPLFYVPLRAHRESPDRHASIRV